MSHTPAPWKIGYNDGSGPEYITGAEPTGKAVLTLRWGCGCCKESVDTFDEMSTEEQANARRIVALINECENISTEDIEGGVISSWAKTVTEHQETLLELQTLKAVNDLLKFENERMMAELSKNIVSDSEQTALDPKLKYAPWESLDTQFKFQAYDSDGWLCSYENKPTVNLSAGAWQTDGNYDPTNWQIPVLGPIPNWQQTLIERPTDQDCPTEPDPSDLAHDHNEITYGADNPTEYDPS